MPVIICRGCQARLKVPDNMAGHTAKCPTCQGLIEVPEEGQMYANPVAPSPALAPSRRAAPPDVDDDDDPRPRRRAAAEEDERPRRRRDEDDDDRPRRRRADDEDEDEPRARRRRDELDDDDDEDDRPRRRRKRPVEEGNPLLMYALIGGGALLLIVLCVVGLLFAFSGDWSSGPQRWTVTLPPQSQNSKDVQLTAGKQVTLRVTSTWNGPAPPDVDLHILDASTQQILLMDESIGPNSFLQFTPQRTARYRIRVVNLDKFTRASSTVVLE